MRKLSALALGLLLINPGLANSAGENEANTGGQSTEAADLFASDADEASAEARALSSKEWYWSAFSCIGMKEVEFAAAKNETAPFGFDTSSSFIEFDYEATADGEKFTGWTTRPFLDRQYTERKVPVTNMMLSKLRTQFTDAAVSQGMVVGSEEFQAMMDRKAKVIGMLTGIPRMDIFGKLADDTDVWYRYHDIYGYKRSSARTMELVSDASSEEAKHVADSLRGIMSQQIMMQSMSPDLSTEVKVLRIPFERDVELYEILREDGSYAQMPEQVVNYLQMNRARPADYNKEPAAQLTVGLWKALADEPDLQAMFKRTVYKGTGYMYVSIHAPYSDPFAFDGMVYASVRLKGHPAKDYFENTPLGVIEAQRVICKREKSEDISKNKDEVVFDAPSDEDVASVLANMRKEKVEKSLELRKILADVGMNVDLSEEEIENGLKEDE